jgi:hypothetical protein
VRGDDHAGREESWKLFRVDRIHHLAEQPVPSPRTGRATTPPILTWPASIVTWARRFLNRNSPTPPLLPFGATCGSRRAWGPSHRPPARRSSLRLGHFGSLAGLAGLNCRFGGPGQADFDRTAHLAPPPRSQGQNPR